MEQQQIQLTEMMLRFSDRGDIKNARKIAQKIIANDKKRLLEISKLEINSNNYKSIMSELGEIDYSTRIGNRSEWFFYYHKRLEITARQLKRI